MKIIIYETSVNNEIRAECLSNDLWKSSLQTNAPIICTSCSSM